MGMMYRTIFGYDVIVDTGYQVTIRVGDVWITAKPDELSKGDWKYSIHPANGRAIVSIRGSWLTYSEALWAGIEAATSFNDAKREYEAYLSSKSDPRD